MKFALDFPVVAEAPQQANNKAMLTAVNQIGQLLYTGAGVPAFTPDGGGPALFLRTNGAAATTLYVYVPGTGWVAK